VIARQLFLFALGLFLLFRGLQTSTVPAMLLGCVLLALSTALVAGLIAANVQEHRRQLRTGELTRQAVTYRVGRLGSSVDRSRGEHRATLGVGAALFEAASAKAVRWEVKTRSGFRVTRVGEQGAFSSDEPVRIGEAAVVRWGLLRETVQVVRVVREPRRRGFAYGTLPRHPLIGEEAFLVEWNADDSVDLVIRSFSRPNGFGWTLLWPVMQVARQVFLRRYLRALLD
jgi:uncharacterized protein (UPF0548 family)